MPNTRPLVLLPAVDVAGGRAVRPVRGTLGTIGAASTDGDPLSAALSWQQAGAHWIHLVDLDAAFGRGSNADLLATIVAHLDVAVELSGGIRDAASLSAALSTGCARVVLSTAALEDPTWAARAVSEHGDRVAVGLDVRGTVLAARGASSAPPGVTRTAGDLEEALDRLEAAGAARYVVTDVTRDGALLGPNVDLLRQICARTDAPLIASGGVSSLADIVALRELVSLGLEGVIVGKALYAGVFTLPQALAAAREPTARV